MLVGFQLSLRDRATIESMLRRLPGEIGASVLDAIRLAGGTSRHEMHWRDDMRRAYWVSVDGGQLLCMTLPSITETQTRMCEREIDLRACHADFDAVVAVYRAVTGRDPKVVRQ